MPPSDRAEFIQHLEAKYRAEGDFAMLREIKAYKALASSPTTSSPISTPEPPTD